MLWVLHSTPGYCHVCLLLEYKSWFIPYTWWNTYQHIQSFLSQLGTQYLLRAIATRMGDAEFKAARVRPILSKQAGKFSIIPYAMMLEATGLNQKHKHNTQLGCRAAWNWHAEFWLASSNLTLLIPLTTLIGTLPLLASENALNEQPPAHLTNCQDCTLHDPAARAVWSCFDTIVSRSALATTVTASIALLHFFAKMLFHSRLFSSSAS